MMLAFGITATEQMSGTAALLDRRRARGTCSATGSGVPTGSASDRGGAAAVRALLGEVAGDQHREQACRTP
jgi:hypothetical protein